MAPRFLTTRLQRSGYRFLIRRQEQAFVRRDVRGLSNPFSAQTSAVAVGVFLVGLMAVVGLLVSVVKPRPDRGLDSIITTSSGGIYVMHNRKLHPVTNLASARLIVGRPDNSSPVKDDTIKDIPRGPLMGIPSAPSSLVAHTDDPAVWTVCDRRDMKSDLSLTTKDTVSTTLIAGKDMLDPKAKTLDSDQAILARSSTSPDRLWLIFDGKRTELGKQDFATQAALGITPAKLNSAITLSGSLIDAIEVLPTLTVPFLENRGRVSSTVPQRAIGDVLTIGDPQGQRDHYVVADQGVQSISPVVAGLLVNTGSRQTVEPDPESVTSLPQVQVIDVSRYPSQIPELVDAPTTCYSWSRSRTDSRSQTKIVVGDALPIQGDKSGTLVDLLRPDPGVVQASASAMDPGKGWYVRVTGSGPESMSAEQLMFIDDTGTRYFISPDKQGSYDPVVGALGLNTQLPLPIPWAIAKLYIQGSTLSTEDAMVYHAFIPPNKNGVPAPPKAGTLSPPPIG